MYFQCPAPVPVSHNVSYFPRGNLVAAIPLNSTCFFCNAETARDLSTSTIQIPVPVQMNLSSGLPEPSCSQQQHQRPWKVGDNPLLDNYYEPTLYAPRLTYIPPERSARKFEKLTTPGKLKGLYGMDKWYVRRQVAQLQTTSISKNKLRRIEKGLKRLRQHHSRRLWKLERRLMHNELEEIRQSKLEMLRRKGIKAGHKEECPLWNCPRKEYQRKRPFMPLKRRTRSLSSLSDLSRRSRSPIVFYRRF